MQHDIPARSGSPLGVLFAALDPHVKPAGEESQTLTMAIGLIALAIETRRLYSDLVHRSEFDLLTDIHNRFSLDQHLHRQIREARETAGIFGLIYIDLDQFKLVNDSHGHHVGDLYLQEAAIRMKHRFALTTSWQDSAVTSLPLWSRWCEAEPMSRRSRGAWNVASTSRLSSRATLCVAQQA